MSRFVEGQGRNQVTLLPECLDDDIGEDSTVRLVDVFIEELDMVALGFAGATPLEIGRLGKSMLQTKLTEAQTRSILVTNCLLPEFLAMPDQWCTGPPLGDF